LGDYSLAAEADAQAEVLVNALDPYQGEIEHTSPSAGQRRFTGLMAGYLRITTKLRFAGSALRGRIPLPNIGQKAPDDADWDVTAFAYDCAKAAGERVLDQRTAALVNKLLVEADGKGFPLTLLTDPTRTARATRWPDKRTRSLTEALAEVEKEVTRPTGWRKIVRGGLTLAANFLPGVILVASVVVLVVVELYHRRDPPFARAHAVADLRDAGNARVVLHLLISILLPVRWAVIKGDFPPAARSEARGRATTGVPAGAGRSGGRFGRGAEAGGVVAKEDGRGVGLVSRAGTSGPGGGVVRRRAG